MINLKEISHNLDIKVDIKVEKKKYLFNKTFILKKH